MSVSAFQRRRRELAKKEVKKEEKTDLSKMTVPQLKELAKEKEIEGFSNMNKGQLLEALGE